jgi:tetratricopeptide (TPR) repeat protein
VLGPITCAACGAKVRKDRPVCLRCGLPLRQAPVAPRAKMTSLALMAGAIALGGVSALIIASAPREQAAEAAPRSAAVTVSTTTPEAPNPSRPDPVFASREVSRGAIAAYGRGDIVGSLEQFQAAVDADPQNADALNNLGQMLVRSGRPREAMPYFDRAVQIAGGVWAYHFNRARAHGQLAQWSPAVAGYREAARLFPDDYITQFNLAKALQANGELDQAVSGFARAIELAPGQTDFHLSHAQALEAAGRPADAATAYRRYLELENTAPEADKIRARIARLEGAPAAMTAAGPAAVSTPKAP